MASDLDRWAAEREKMIRVQLRGRGISDPRILSSMASVPRHEFVSAGLQDHAYEDSPLAISCRQTISQPYIVARMLELARLTGSERVLEIGAGSGYQTALLSLLAKQVCALELEEELWQAATQRIEKMGSTNVDLRLGSGLDPWPEGGEFDVILSACAPEIVPEVLVDQLAEGGRLIIPVGPHGGVQDLLCLRMLPDHSLIEESCEPVHFVQMR